MNEQRPDDDGPVRPQVIDLEAEEIRTEPEAQSAKAEDETKAEERWTSEPAAAPAEKPKRKSMAGWIVAALVLGLIAGAWLYRGVLANYFPTNEMKAMQARLDALDINTSSLTDQLATLRQTADGAAAAAGEAGKTANAAGQLAQQAADGLGSLDSKLGALDQRVASAETALGQAQADLDGFRKSLSTAASSGTSSGPAVDSAVLASLGQRLDALEKDVASLKSSASQGGGSDKASVTSALSQALSDLKAKVAVGAPYAPEYDRISRMVPAAAGLEAVGARAVEGLPNAQGLAAELRAAIPTLPQPAPPAAEDDSYLGSLVTSLSGLITIRNTGETDWPSIAEKAAAFAESGDLDQAVGVIDSAGGEKPTVLTQWRDRAASRLQLEVALDQVSEAVLRQITALGGAQEGGAQ